ncbi:MAG: PepSY-associated TM helix domain-containing protein [Pseudomonadota bacterium]
MNLERHHRNYDLHSWSGLALGLFIFVVCFTGCLALFDAELHAWEDPAKRMAVPEQPAPMDATFTEWISEQLGEDGKAEFINFTFPTAYQPYYTAYMNFETPNADGGHDHTAVQQSWNAATGAPFEERGDGLSAWLRDFHRDLMWPAKLGGRSVGRGLVGIAGVILLLSIVSGVVAHTKIMPELFTLRFFRSMRLKWQDTHKVLGLWGLPFYTMIAVTGAIIGVVTLLAPVIAVLTFKGDTEALFEAVIGAPLEASGRPANMLSVDDIRGFTSDATNEPAWYVVANNWGDENARFDVYFQSTSQLKIVDGYQISGVTGERIPDSQFENVTAGSRTSQAVTPLHYGTYGGIVLKFVYFALGLSLAVITALGMMMWVERRLYGNAGKRSPRVYKALSKLTVGVTCGLPLASAFIFYADKLVPIAPDARITMIGQAYFACWAVGILHACVRGNDYQAAKELLYVTAAMVVGLPFLNATVTGEFFVAHLTTASSVSALTDLTALIFGLLMLLAVWSLPDARKEKQARRSENRDTVAADDASLMAAE